MEIQDHKIIGIAQKESPNYDDRPKQTPISLIVIHCISLPPGEFGGDYVDALFSNRLDSNAHPYFREICDLKVSAHLFIRRGGEIIQYVPFDKRAWHAGKSRFQGIECCNDYSIGIELEGTEHLEYTNQQYDHLGAIIDALLRKYPDLSVGRITGHSDIASGRKTDPGDYFDWQRLYDKLTGAVPRIPDRKKILPSGFDLS